MTAVLSLVYVLRASAGCFIDVPLVDTVTPITHCFGRECVCSWSWQNTTKDLVLALADTADCLSLYGCPLCSLYSSSYF